MNVTPEMNELILQICQSNPEQAWINGGKARLITNLERAQKELREYEEHEANLAKHREECWAKLFKIFTEQNKNT